MKHATLASVCVLALTLLTPIVGQAAKRDPLVGTWNISGNATGLPFIAVMTFNEGGTLVEFDTSGTNSSSSPGESIFLGSWTNTGPLTYTSTGENYIYDASGNLSLVVVGSCTLNLASTLKTFNSQCSGGYYNCTVDLCPGTLVQALAPLSETGTRF